MAASTKKSWVSTDTDTPDRTVKCKDCASDFVFEGWEQDWFRQRGWYVATKMRCAECVKARKAAQATKDAGGRKCFNCWSSGLVSKECTEAKAKRPKRKSEDDSLTTKELKKTNRPCHAFQRGGCSRGAACMFLHDASNLPAANEKPQKPMKLPKVSAHPFDL